jgi:hypothetical protein
MVMGLPDHENVRALKAEMWGWIEMVNEKDKQKLSNPLNEIFDENQDTLMSMNFGLSDYGRLKYMLEMADILKDKKRFEKEGAEANKKKIE